MKRKGIIGSLLIVIGLIIVVFSFSSHINRFMEMHTNRVSDNAQVIDSNIVEAFDDTVARLEYVISRPDFEKKEHIYNKTGDISQLADKVNRNMLSQDKYVSDMLVLENNKVLYSSKEIYDYKFIWINGIDNVCICTQDDINYRVGIVCKKNNLSYMLLLEAKDFFEYVGDEKNQMQDGVLLIDAEAQFLMYSHEREFFVGELKQAENKIEEIECVEVLLEAHKKEEENVHSFEHQKSMHKEKHSGYVYSLPAGKTRNKIFTIGVVMQPGDMISGMRQAVIGAMFGGAFFTVGVIILLYTAYIAWKDVQKRKEQIQQLTEQNQNLQELAHKQRLETIGVLAAGIAHEFNNLLTPIMGYSMMVMEKVPEDDEETYENLIEIYNSSRKAKEIISRLSDLSRKKDMVLFDLHSVNQLIVNALNTVKPVQPKNVQVECDLETPDVKINCNDIYMVQLIINLIMNAFQAMSDIGGTLSIRTSTYDNSVIISVEDTGTGIPEEIKEKIFEPFFTTKHTSKGTGLGLALVQQIVDMHQGQIVVEDNQPTGSIFKVIISYEK